MNKILKLNEEQLNDLLSACTFTRAEYERTRKQKAPIFLKELAKIEKKLWAAIRKKP